MNEAEAIRSVKRKVLTAGYAPHVANIALGVAIKLRKQGESISSCVGAALIKASLIDERIGAARC